MCSFVFQWNWQYEVSLCTKASHAGSELHSRLILFSEIHSLWPGFSGMCDQTCWLAKALQSFLCTDWLYSIIRHRLEDGWRVNTLSQILDSRPCACLVQACTYEGILTFNIWKCFDLNLHVSSTQTLIALHIQSWSWIWKVVLYCQLHHFSSRCQQACCSFQAGACCLQQYAQNPTQCLPRRLLEGLIRDRTPRLHWPLAPNTNAWTFGKADTRLLHA